MSDRVVQSHSDCDVRSVQPMHSYQSSWMAHWMRTSCNVAPQCHNQLSRAKSAEVQVEVASDFSKSAEGFTETEAKIYKITNGSRASSKNLRNERLGSQCFPIFDLSQNNGAGFASKNDTGSSSDVVPYKLDCREYKLNRGKSVLPSMCRPEESQETKQLSSTLASKKHLPNHNLTILEHEHNYRSHSAFWGCEEKANNSSNSGKSLTPYRRHNNKSLFLDEPSPGNDQLPGGQYQGMQSSSGIGLFPSRCYPLETKKLEKIYQGCCSLQRMPHSVHDVETMRICTTLDSVEGLPGGPPRYSQTTHSLLITKKTDVNLRVENQVFEDSRLCSQYKGNVVSKLQSGSRLFGHGAQGVRLRPRGTSMDSEEKENTKDAEVDSKSESSAETESMDNSAFKKNRFSGVNYSPLNKEMMVAPNLPPRAAIPSAREQVGCSQPRNKLPDINLELPPLSAAASKIPDINLELPAQLVAASSMDNAEPSTSRTCSLDMKLVLPHAEQPDSSKSNHFPDVLVRPEPSSRWVKRLKLSDSDSFPLGTKISNMDEASSHEKMNKFFDNIMKDNIFNSEPKLDKCHGKELIELDQSKALLRNGKSSSAQRVEKSREITSSHYWIQRWCHNRAATRQKDPEALVICEPRSSKVSLEDFQKKQFPSVAAMALVGKAMRGTQPCEVQNMGSFVIWNTKRS